MRRIKILSDISMQNWSRWITIEPIEINYQRSIKLDAETHESANQSLANLYLSNVDTIPEITDIVYAMGKSCCVDFRS